MTTSMSNWNRALTVLTHEIATIQAAPVKMIVSERNESEREQIGAKEPVIVRIPAHLDEACPKCGSSNDPKKYFVWMVSDERGLHLECDVCSNAWKPAHAK